MVRCEVSLPSARYAACLWGHIERRAPSFGLQKDNDIDVYIGLDVSPRL
jgi:hypothetical protein